MLRLWGLLGLTLLVCGCALRVPSPEPAPECAQRQADGKLRLDQGTWVRFDAVAAPAGWVLSLRDILGRRHALIWYRLSDDQLSIQDDRARRALQGAPDEICAGSGPCIPAALVHRVLLEGPDALEWGRHDCQWDRDESLLQCQALQLRLMRHRCAPGSERLNFAAPPEEYDALSLHR